MQPNNPASPILKIVIQVANEYKIFKEGWEKAYVFRALTAIKREHNLLEDIVMNSLKNTLEPYEILAFFDSRYKTFTSRFRVVMNKVEPLNQDHYKFIEDYSINLSFVDNLALHLWEETAEGIIK